MHVIETLFSARPNSERLHQAALKVLLEKTWLLAKLTGRDLQAGRVQWEPEGGATDLVVETTTGEKIWIELKIDSVLSRGQIEAQFTYNAPPSGLLYVLLGASEISHGMQWGHWADILRGRPCPAIVDGQALARYITDALEPSAPAEIRELAEGYKLVLAHLGQRTQQFHNKSISEFKEQDFLGFFHRLRTEEPLGTTSTVSPVRAKGRHFVCCAWAGVPSLGLYFQFENQFLYLKLHGQHLDKTARKHRRKQALEAARAAAAALNVQLEPTKGRTGKHMTLAKLPFVLTSSDPKDPQLLAAVRSAHELVIETGKRLK